MRASTSTILATLFAISASAADVPANIKSFRDSIKAAGSCSNKLSAGFAAGHGSADKSFTYCGDHLDSSKVVYLQGTNGKLADMDIDCDGQQKGKGDDGRCGFSQDTQSQTSFMGTLAGYKKGVTDLNPFIHSYVVFGNVGSKGSFDPRSKGIEPLSLMAVVCGDEMFYGVWGDENGDDGPNAVIGEASLSVATLCFGKEMNGNAGHGEPDVLYIAFTDKDAVPGAEGARWDAATAEDFQTSIKGLGDKLIQRIGGGGTSTEAKPTTLKKVTSPSKTPQPEIVVEETVVQKSTGTTTCSWPGHCAGATCSTENVCSDDLTCKSGKCA